MGLVAIDEVAYEWRQLVELALIKGISPKTNRVVGLGTGLGDRYRVCLPLIGAFNQALKLGGAVCGEDFQRELSFDIFPCSTPTDRG